MAKIISAIVVLFFLSTGMELETSGPDEVEISTSKGTFRAEILSIRTDTLVMVSPSGLQEDEIRYDSGKVFVVRDEDIRRIRTIGHSYVAIGGLTGAAIGCATGYLIGSSIRVEQRPSGCNSEGEERVERLNNELVYGTTCGVGGMLFGMVGGGIASTRDSVWFTERHRDFNALRDLARYPYQEPPFLRTVVK